MRKNLWIIALLFWLVVIATMCFAQVTTVSVNKIGVWHKINNNPVMVDYEILETHKICGHIMSEHVADNEWRYYAYIGAENSPESEWTTLEGAEKGMERVCAVIYGKERKP